MFPHYRTYLTGSTVWMLMLWFHQWDLRFSLGMRMPFTHNDMTALQCQIIMFCCACYHKSTIVSAHNFNGDSLQNKATRMVILNHHYHWTNNWSQIEVNDSAMAYLYAKWETIAMNNGTCKQRPLLQPQCFPCSHLRLIIARSGAGSTDQGFD